MLPSIAIVGTGAVGGFYGSLLKRAGYPVHFLVRSDYAEIQQHGITVISRERVLNTGSVLAYSDVNSMPPCDVVLVTLKTTSNSELPSILPHLHKPDGITVIMQNGMGTEERVADLLGSRKVLGALSFVAANKIGPGLVHHLDYGEVMLADLRGGMTEELKIVAGLFEAAGIPVKTSENLALARWRKLVWNIPYNGLSVALGLTTDRIMADPSHAARVRRIMNEVVAMAGACGHVIDQDFVARMLNDTIRMKPYKPSMMLDFEKGRMLETDTIYRAPLELGEAAGARAPETEELYRQILDRVKQRG